MATTTNYGWTTPDDTALVKDGAAAIRTLGSSVDTTTKNLNPETTLGDIAYRSSTANVKTRLGLGTAGQVLQVNSGATAPEWAALPGSLSYAIFRDEKAQNTAGGTFTSGAWRTRDLNTTQFNNITSASLSSNQITLPSGTYLIDGFAPAAIINKHQTRLQNITDSTTTLIGQNAFNEPASFVETYSRLSGIITIAATKTFELQHRSSATTATEGLGVANNLTTEVYSSITITKVA
jgi:hypothetical protein